MGMRVEDFYDMIPKHFFNKLNGFFELEQMRERNEWERTRWQTCYLLNIQIAKGKKLKLTDLIWQVIKASDSLTSYLERT
mgnify:CR=1 FL=1